MARRNKPELEIERSICDYLYAKRIFFWKQPNQRHYNARTGSYMRDPSGYALRGIPDIIAIISGHFIGFEVKAKSGTQSPHQRAFELGCKSAGGYYFLVRSIEDVQNALNELDFT